MPSLNHGTARAYDQGCRCADCRAANTERTRKKRAKKREAEGKSPVVRPPRSRPAGTAPTEPPAAPLRLKGEIERAVEEDLDSTGSLPGIWFATHKATALTIARALDEADPQLTARLYPQLLDALARLGIHPPASPAAESGTAAGGDRAAVNLVADDELADATSGIRIQGGGPTALRYPA